MVSGSIGTYTGYTTRQITGFRVTGVPDLRVGELVMWTGEQGKFSSFDRRIVYQVVERREPAENETVVQYRFRAMFDIENPMGLSIDVTPFMSARNMKRISLLDLGIIRLTFDNFIKEWAAAQGLVLEQMPVAEDVKT